MKSNDLVLLPSKPTWLNGGSAKDIIWFMRNCITLTGALMVWGDDGDAEMWAINPECFINEDYSEVVNQALIRAGSSALKCVKFAVIGTRQRFDDKTLAFVPAKTILVSDWDTTHLVSITNNTVNTKVFNESIKKETIWPSEW